MKYTWEFEYVGVPVLTPEDESRVNIGARILYNLIKRVREERENKAAGLDERPLLSTNQKSTDKSVILIPEKDPLPDGSGSDPGLEIPGSLFPSLTERGSFMPALQGGADPVGGAA